MEFWSQRNFRVFALFMRRSALLGVLEIVNHWPFIPQHGGSFNPQYFHPLSAFGFSFPSRVISTLITLPFSRRDQLDWIIRRGYRSLNYGNIVHVDEMFLEEREDDGGLHSGCFEDERSRSPKYNDDGHLINVPRVQQLRYLLN